jgi:hypothetical protein
MAYGELKVDSITFTDGGTDTTVSVSGLVQNPTFSGDITVTGTISGDVILGGTTVSGTTVTGLTANFVSGVFTSQVSGATVTGDAGEFGTVTATGVSLNGPFKQASEAVAALDVDCSTGNYFTKSISSNSTFTFSNIPASGTAYSFTLEVDVTGTSTAITWPASVEWPYGITAPSLTDTKTHLFMFVTNDNGTTWRGAALVNYTT